MSDMPTSVISLALHSFFPSIVCIDMNPLGYWKYILRVIVTILEKIVAYTDISQIVFKHMYIYKSGLSQRVYQGWISRISMILPGVFLLQCLLLLQYTITITLLLYYYSSAYCLLQCSSLYCLYKFLLQCNCGTGQRTGLHLN